MLYDNVRRMCEQKGISVSMLEKKMEFSNGSISKWNDNEPGIRKVQKVADYFGVAIEDLLGVGGENVLKKFKNRE